MKAVLADHPDAGSWRDIFTGYTGLHWAAKRGVSDMVDVCMAAGADINAKSFGG